MFILILTLAWSQGHGAAASIEHVPGFTSNTACLAAGNAWINHMDTSKAKAICVKAQ